MELLTAEDMAARLGHSPRWWKEQAAARSVPHFRHGRVIGWTEDHVAQIVAQRTVGPVDTDPLLDRAPRSHRRRTA